MKSNEIVKKVINFLKMFMPETLAKRIVCMLLLSVGTPLEEIREISGFCDKTIKNIEKKLKHEEIGSLFEISGGGRKSKVRDVEKEIIDEINAGQYHTRQQISDMIYEKHGIKISVNAVGELLKKKGLRN